MDRPLTDSEIDALLQWVEANYPSRGVEIILEMEKNLDGEETTC